MNSEEIPLVDLRIVDNIERSSNKWQIKAMNKFISLTESIHDDDNDNNNCPSGIPHHNCPRSKEITVNREYEGDGEIVKVYAKYDPNTKFLVRQKVIDKVNSKLPSPHYIISPQYVEESSFIDYPHPSNHNL